MTSISKKFTIHRLLENTPEANQLLESSPLHLLPMGDPVNGFILCMDTPRGRRFVGAVPKAVRARMLELYNQHEELTVKWCSPSIYANSSVIWIEVIASNPSSGEAQLMHALPERLVAEGISVI